MTEERKNIWYEYTQHLCNQEGIDALGYMKGAKLFMENAETLNKRGYNRFLKEHAYKLSVYPRWKTGIIDLLDFLGAGFKTNKNQKKELKLEKLSDISEKNKQNMNKYANYLLQDNDYSKCTLYTYLCGVKKFFEYANDFNNENCRRYIATLEAEGFKPETIRLRITSLEKYSEFINKPVKLKRPKFQRKLNTDNIPTEKEYEKLLEYLKGCRDKRWYFYVKTLATTGARISEFLQFKWEDILNGEVILKGKGNKYRRFFFKKSLQDEVKGFLKLHHYGGVMCISRYGRPITNRGFSTRLKDIGRKCDIDSSKMHPHAFRHFFAKMYLKKTKDVVQLADLLGHGSIDTTRIYLQKSYEEQKRDFNRNITW